MLRLFGPLTVEHEGRVLPLPASRKTRAILGFLVLSPRPVTRQRLCDLFFDVPDDPRAALRWSLSKLRPVLDVAGQARLVSERDTLRIDLARAEVDAHLLRDALAGDGLAAGLDEGGAVALLDAMAGDLLEDCELPDRPEYGAWLAAQREEFRTLALALVRRLADAAEGEARIVHLRRLLTLDPADGPAVTALAGALVEGGRRAEAEAVIADAQRHRRALGLAEDPLLRRALRPVAATATAAAVPPPPPAALASGAEGEAAPQAADGRPAIAVLPLLDHSGGALAPELVAPFTPTAAHMLSRFREVRVCRMAASNRFGGLIVDPVEVGAKLGVDYLLTSAVLVREGAIKLRASIIAAADGEVLSSWEHVQPAAEAQAMLDGMPARLAVHVARTLVQAARAKALALPEHQRGKWDHFHAGVVLGLAATPADYPRALACFEKAIALDDRFARAIGCAAWAKACLGYRADEAKRQEALMQAHRAIAIGLDDAEALSVGAWAAVHVALDFEAGLRASAQATRANPLSRVAWGTSGWIRAMAGEPDTPLAHLDRAEACDPDDANLDNVDGGRAFCHWLAGRHAAAAAAAERSLRILPGHVGAHVVAMAAALGAGRRDEARAAAQRFLGVFPQGAATPAIRSIPLRSRERLEALVAAVAEACRLVSPQDGEQQQAESVAGAPAAPAPRPASATPLVAVLPFADQSVEPLPGHILDGFFEGLVHAMSRFNSIDVVAGASTLAMRERASDPVGAAQALGADVLVLGSIARARDDRLRLRWRAVEGTSGRTLALGEIAGMLGDVWELQEDAATAIAVEVEPRAQAEAHRARLERPTASPAAYDLYLRGLFTGFSHEGRDYAGALACFREALAIDPDFHPALAMAPWAAAYANLIAGPDDIRHYAEMSRAALRFGINDARTQATAGTALFYMAKDFVTARQAIDRAIRLNPNEYTAWICGGWMDAMKGEAAEAHRKFDRATRLNPLAYGANGLLSGRAMADFMIGAIDTAEGHIRTALATDDSHPSVLMTGVATAAALGLADELAERRRRFLAIYPGGLADYAVASLPFEDPACRTRYFDAVRAGGVPG